MDKNQKKSTTTSQKAALTKVASVGAENLIKPVMEKFIAATVQRLVSGKNDTLGEMTINDIAVCSTIEDEQREIKVKGETRIAAGIYRLTLRNIGGHHERYLKKYGAKWHKGMIELMDVPNFQYILIHIGNTEKDTDGCIVIGNNPVYDKKAEKYNLFNSRVVYESVYPVLRDLILEGEKNNQFVYIEIKD